MDFRKFLVLIFVFVPILLFEIAGADDTIFANPIFPRNSADPAALRLGNYYYLTLSEDGMRNLTVFKSSNLTNFRNAESKVVFPTPEGFYDLWAPEMHKINGQLLIYFTFAGGGDPVHRMYVIEAEDPDNPMGNWKPPIKLDTFPDDGGIDGTVLQHGDGNLYFAFSSMASNWLARMVNTTYVNATEIVLLRRPEAEWECRGMNGPLCMSEGPFFIYNQGVSYMTFSASETMSPHYCTGLMSIDGDKDPMIIENWWRGPDGPVFFRNDEESVYCTGHAAFTVSPDGKETWMVYHATDSPTDIVGNRVARIEKIEWGSDGRPVFPRPHGYDHPFAVPSGQDEVQHFTNPIFPRNSADPNILHLGDYYYLSLSENLEHNLTVFKSRVMTNFRDVESKVVFETPPGYTDLWAPEMHLIKGQLVIYFTMQGGGESHRMYVIEAEDPTNPMGNWKPPIKLMPNFALSAIDGTVLQHGNGEMYFVFSSIDCLCLWIAKMVNVTYVDPSEYVLLRKPVENWECLGLGGRTLCLNEGAYFLYNRNVSYMVFSVSETFGPDYSLGMMSIESSKDPMVPENWEGPDGPVFYRNDAENVYTTGHAAFTDSPDGTETWMVYHASDSPTFIQGNRIARIEKIDWDKISGRPIFPRPHGFGTYIQAPSGQLPA